MWVLDEILLSVLLVAAIVVLAVVLNVWGTLALIAGVAAGFAAKLLLGVIDRG